MIAPITTLRSALLGDVDEVRRTALALVKSAMLRHRLVKDLCKDLQISERSYGNLRAQCTAIQQMESAHLRGPETGKRGRPLKSRD